MPVLRSRWRVRRPPSPDRVPAGARGRGGCRSRTTILPAVRRARRTRGRPRRTGSDGRRRWWVSSDRMLRPLVFSSRSVGRGGGTGSSGTRLRRVRGRSPDSETPLEGRLVHRRPLPGARRVHARRVARASPLWTAGPFEKPLLPCGSCRRMSASTRRGTTASLPVPVVRRGGQAGRRYRVAQPASTTGPPPARSVRRPLIGSISTAPIPWGASSSPAFSALSPRSTW